jgi:hypothetical protein
MTQSILKAAAGVAALAAIAFGASAIASGSKSNTSSLAGGPPGPGAAGFGQRPRGAAPPGMNGTPPAGAPGVNGSRPPGGPRAGGPGFGTPLTGATAAKVKAAALAKYPGTLERAVQLPDGNYMAHVFASGGEVHVLVNRQFQVTGVRAGPPGGGPPQGQN